MAPAVLGSVTVSGDVLAGSIGEVGGTGFFVTSLRVTNLADSARSWSTVLNLGNPIPPVTTVSVGGNRILLGEGPNVRAFTRTRPTNCSGSGSTVICAPVWSRTLGGRATVPVLSQDETTVYVGDEAGGVWALNALDGTILWEASLTGGGTPQVWAPPTLGDGHLYVTSSDGRLYVFDADGCGGPVCTATWAAATGSPIDKQSPLAGGVIYVGSQDGTVHAFRASGCGAVLCAPLWETATGSRITGGPIVTSGNLIVGTADGRLIAYRPS